MTVVDGVLGHRPPVRDLGGVDHLDVRRQLGEQFRWRQPVGDDDVGLGEQAPAAHGDQFGVTGSAADQRDAAAHHVGALGALGRDDAGLQRLADGRADRRRPAVLAAGQDPDGQPGVVERRRGHRGALDGDVGADAEDAAAVGLGDDRLVHLRVVGGRDRVPGAVEVTVAVVAQRQGDSASSPRRPGWRCG